VKVLLAAAALVLTGCGDGNSDASASSGAEDDLTPADLPDSAWDGWRLFGRHIDEFEAQERDEAWATPAERALTSSFAAGEKELGFSLASVECRTNKCILVTQWDSFANARRQLTEIGWLTPMEVNCSGGAALSPKPDKPYEVYIVVDCYECSGSICPSKAP
jgi:hypothetical protein